MLNKKQIRQIVDSYINEEMPEFMHKEGWTPKEDASYDISLENMIEEGIELITRAYYNAQIQ